MVTWKTKHIEQSQIFMYILFLPLASTDTSSTTAARNTLNFKAESFIPQEDTLNQLHQAKRKNKPLVSQRRLFHDYFCPIEYKQ